MTRCEVRPGVWRGWVLTHAACLALCVTPVAAQETTPVVPQMLRLQDAIRIALESSNNIGIQQAQLEATRKARTNAWFNLGPDLNASGTYSKSTRTDYDVTTISGPGDTVTTDIDSKSDFKEAQASSSIRLFDGFANYNRIAAARHDVNAQEHSVEYTRQGVTELVIDTYLNLLRAKLLVGVAVESERVSRDQLDRTQALYELGSSARSDVLKQQVQHNQTRLDLVRANQLERQSHVDLEWAMNLEHETAFDIDTTLAQIQYKTKDYNTERDYALVNRENLLSFRAREKASSKRVWVARGQLLPTLDFQYSVSRARTPPQFSFGGNSLDRRWGFFANWNIWDRYSNYAAIGQAKANSRIAEYDRRQAELDAVREVRRLVNDMDEARERLGVSRESVVSAREDLRLAQEKFRVGAGTILDTVVAESDLTRARANEVQAIVDYLIARARLARATGRPLSEV